MYRKITKIINKSGLHARPATEFAEIAKKFDCSVMVAREDEPDFAVNAKSVALLLTLGLSTGEGAVVSADGEGQEEAVDALAAFIDSGMGE